MSGRLENLRLAQRTIVARLDDPSTPPYSIAPLTNQLRLVEKQIDQLTAGDRVDHGLPDVEHFGLVDALAYERWLRAPHLPARRKPVNAYFQEQAGIFEEWQRAGFELSPRSGSTAEWVEENRTRLVECLEREARNGR